MDTMGIAGSDQGGEQEYADRADGHLSNAIEFLGLGQGKATYWSGTVDAAGMGRFRVTIEEIDEA